MKLSKAEEREVLDAYEAYWINYLRGDTANVISLLDNDVTMVGSSEIEVFYNVKEASRFFKASAKEIAGKVEMRNRQIVERAADRAQLLVALESEGVLPSRGGLHQVGFPEMTAELAAAVYTYLARAPSKLLLLQLEDGFGALEQPNLPGAPGGASPLGTGS